VATPLMRRETFGRDGDFKKANASRVSTDTRKPSPLTSHSLEVGAVDTTHDDPVSHSDPEFEYIISISGLEDSHERLRTQKSGA
jgi:hypothetical protein